MFLKDFPTEEACLKALFAFRYPGVKAYLIKGRKQFVKDGKHYSPLAGTIFEGSRTSLRSWFFALFLFASSRNGVSAKELQRQLGITYKCAYRMGMQIRKLFNENPRLKGVVEVDEAYINGRERKVFGMMERDGKVRTQLIPDLKTNTIVPIIRENVEPLSKLYTDRMTSYRGLWRDFDHRTVNHLKKEYVRGEVHINTLEGFWGQVKSSLQGTYHYVSSKYLSAYLSEFSWRYNHRKENLFSAMLLAASKRP